MIDLASPFFLFFNVTATTDIYTLSLHDALPILHGGAAISRRAELPGQHRGQTDADLHRLDRADVRVEPEDRKSTRLNSSHTVISYAVFCLKKKKNSCPGKGHPGAEEARNLRIST